MSDRPPVTKMTHPLPFERLSPADFERLCLWLVEREGYERAEALGEAGGEQGRDIVARKDGWQVAFQCKRVRAFGPKSAEKELEKIRKLPADEQPEELIFVVTCAVSAKTRKAARSAWRNGKTCRFWAGHELDQRTKRHPEILNEFFDVGNVEPITTHQARANATPTVTATVAAPLPADQAQEAPSIFLSQLPIVGERLFGRENEIERLDRAWLDPKTNLLSIVAWGGVGKSALVEHWLGRIAGDNYSGAERVFAWSFYKQGTSEQASADEFISFALKWFDHDFKKPVRGLEAGQQLAELIRKRRTLIVLDGLEPLQEPPGPEGGRIRDPAMQSLIRQLAAEIPGLCVLTSRLPVADVEYLRSTTSPIIELEQLSTNAGARLLESLGVKGKREDLEQLSDELKGHALALNLLGTYIRDICDGRIERVASLELQKADHEHGGHARRIMESYQRWFGNGPEVAALRLTGLFDRPAAPELIKVLRQAPVIPRLTDPLFHYHRRRGLFGILSRKSATPFSEEDWSRTVSRLRKAKLITMQRQEDDISIDAHPLVRTYFSNQVKTRTPKAWRTAQVRMAEHIARQAAQISDLSKIDHFMGQLPVANREIAESISEIQDMARVIGQLQARIDSAGSVVIVPLARLQVSSIDNFETRLKQLAAPLANEFLVAAANWRRKALLQLEIVEARSTQPSAAQVFRAGDPVDSEAGAFVPRVEIIRKLQAAISADANVGILLYGRRRMGVSTTVRTLSAFLPESFTVAAMSMQSPGAFGSVELLVDSIYQLLSDSTGGIPWNARPLDSRGLVDFLGELDRRQGGKGQRIVIALDEYAVLDSKINQGTLGEDVLWSIHESISMHRNLIWLLAGNHHFSELHCEVWPRISGDFATVEVDEFSLEETRQLLTTPLARSQLWSDSGAIAPKFEDNFWGEGGVELIHTETGGWPHLVQLVAETVVDLVNDEHRAVANAELVERAFDRAIIRGQTVIHHLMKTESNLLGEWDYLLRFRTSATQPAPDDEVLARSLRRRRIVSSEEGLWHLRVPLMARWLREQG